ncbi:MAG: phage tail terminator-like protein [Solidesulfovibrio sp. DCME]|uniref:phage tail terminator-like protein n=1 Tax=Solidesulfovibrio sp. DCME TaxID=3447380 RepID=UPI003D0B7AF0
MTPDAIVHAVQTHFKANWVATPAFYDNLATPKTLPDKWVRCSILPGKKFSREIGPGGISRRVGVVKVQVFTPAGCGVQARGDVGAGAAARG